MILFTFSNAFNLKICFSDINTKYTSFLLLTLLLAYLFPSLHFIFVPACSKCVCYKQQITRFIQCDSPCLFTVELKFYDYYFVSLICAFYLSCFHIHTHTHIHTNTQIFFLLSWFFFFRLRYFYLLDSILLLLHKKYLKCFWNIDTKNTKCMI